MRYGKADERNFCHLTGEAGRKVQRRRKRCAISVRYIKAANKKSYGLSLNISSNEKTLSDKEIDNLMLKITKNLNLNFGAELRN